jgi:hypothetical protein
MKQLLLILTLIFRQDWLPKIKVSESRFDGTKALYQVHQFWLREQRKDHQQMLMENIISAAIGDIYNFLL